MLSFLTSLLLAAHMASSEPIIVQGRAIQDSKAALASCIARHCPTDEEIDAALSLAENQLIAGKYHDARKTLLASLKRNKDEANRYPIPVSDLYRANGKVAASLGFDKDYYNSTWGIYRTLKYGMPSALDRKYSALMEVAEMMYKTRGHERARVYYEGIMSDAKKDGRPDIAALAELRMIVRHLPPYMRESGIKQLLARTDPSLKAPILEGNLALARIAYADKDEAKGDAIVASLASMKIKQPILIYAPEYKLNSQDDQSFVNTTRDMPNHSSGSGMAAAMGDGPSPATGFGSSPLGMQRMALNTEDMWVDVEFRVNAAGKVENAHIVRSRGNTSWSNPLMESIKGRRYTPVAANSPVALRRERYTYTSGVEDGAGSHLALHSPNARVEYMDLSDIQATE